jgi:DNA-directed RNA polymerase specialized sigma24 family protein
MGDEGDTQDQKRLQEHALQRAKEAAQAGDPKGMLEALVESRVMDGLRRRLDFNWDPTIHPMDRDQIVGDTVDAFYAAVQRGDTISNVTAWLSKVAGNRATEFYRRLQDESALDEDGSQDRDENVPREITDAERDARRRRCLEVARGLLPMISASENVRRVMAFIFDAVEQRIEDLQPVEIARALGLNRSSVRTWIDRGFERLAARAKEAGFTREEYELIKLQIEDEGEDEQTDDMEGDLQHE